MEGLEKDEWKVKGLHYAILHFFLMWTLQQRSFLKAQICAKSTMQSLPFLLSSYILPYKPLWNLRHFSSNAKGMSFDGLEQGRE